MTPTIRKLLADPLAFTNELDQKKYEALISRLDKAYFVANEPSVPDSVYDIVRKNYKKRFPKGSLVSKVGAKGVADVPLIVPMSSLDQLYSNTKVLTNRLNKPVAWVLTDKLDGQSIELVYEGGTLTTMMTRGDSTHGTDRSYHIPALSTVARRISVKTRFIVRCEAIIEQSTFNSKMHKDVGGDYQAARNAAGGIINSNTPDKAKFKHVKFVALEILEGKDAGAPRSRQLATLKAMGFETPHAVKAKAGALTEAKLISYLEKRVGESPYEIDGIVVTEDVPYHHTGSSNPSHEFKFKMNTDAASALVTVESVEFQMSKFGVLNPVIHYPPTKLAGGAMCRRATGHNGFYIEHGYLKGTKNPPPKKAIGPGAVLKIVRSGSVIPYVVEVVRGAKKAAAPDVPFKRVGVDFVFDGDHTELDDVNARRIADFFTNVGIRNAAQTTVLKIITQTKAKNLTRLVTTGVSTLAPAIGVAAARDLTSQIADVLFTKGVRIEQLYAALSPWYIEGMAEQNWAKVLPLLPNDVADISTMKAADVRSAIEEVTALKSKMKELPSAIVQIAKFIARMDFEIKKYVPQKGAKKSKLQGQVVVMTGFRDNALKERLLEAGAKVVSSYTQSVTLVVASDPNDSGSKLQKARAAGTKILSRAQLESML